MKNVGDYVVYKRDVCKVIEIRKNYFHGMDYYILVPIMDTSLKIQIPVDNQNEYMRDLISKDTVEKIVREIPSIEKIQTNDKFIENEYRTLIGSGRHEDLIKIIKTTYLRNKERLENNKRIGEKDNHYFELAERYLYQEFAVVLGLSYDETKKYVIEKVSSLVAEI